MTAPVRVRDASLRDLWLVCRMAFRADPIRAAVVILPFQTIGIAITEWATRAVIDGAVLGDRERVVVWGVIGTLSLAWWVVLALTSFTFDMRLRERMSIALDEHVTTVVGEIPTTEHHDRPDLADNLELLRTDRGLLVGGVSMVSNTTGALGNIVAGAVLLATVDPWAWLIAAAGLPLVFLARRAAAIVESAQRASAEESRRGLHLYDLATDAEAGEELRVFGLTGIVQDRYRTHWRTVDRIRNRANIRAGALVTVGVLGIVTALVVLVTRLADGAARGGVSAGDLALVVSVLLQMVWQLKWLAELGGFLTRTALAAGRIRQLEAHAGAVAQAGAWHDDPAPAPDVLVDGIELHDVTFRYPEAEHATLDSVSLRLPAGSTVAVVGDNGAGKSTLVSLLAGLRRPTAGQITVDGVDLGRIPPSDWFARTSATFQDHADLELVAHETVGVADLSRIGDASAVVPAIERASATDVVDRLEDGLATPLGTTLDGANLSGGQWQKLALARGLHRSDPLLLLLDEPTSALDATAEHRLFESFRSAAADAGRRSGAVTVIVSHRFSTVREADLIVVLDAHGVAEVGTHDELVARAGLYAELYELQAASYR